MADRSQPDTLTAIALQLAELVRDHLADDRLALALRESLRVSAWVKRPDLTPAPTLVTQDLIRIRIAVDAAGDVAPAAAFVMRYFTAIEHRDTIDRNGSPAKTYVVALPLDAVPKELAAADAPGFITIELTTDRAPLVDATVAIVAGSKR